MADGLLQAVDSAHLHHPLHVLGEFEPRAHLHPRAAAALGEPDSDREDGHVRDRRPVRVGVGVDELKRSRWIDGTDAPCYELFADYWGAMKNPQSRITDALNSKPKYVASNSLTEGRWAETTVLSGDLAAALGKLKKTRDGELQVHGSAAPTRWLLETDLVDGIALLVCPVVVGQGTRLFPDTGPGRGLDLIDARAFPKGIALQVYRPDGRPHYATT